MAEDRKLCECGCGRPAPIAKTTQRTRGAIKGQPLRFCVGHAGVKKNKWKEDEFGCWIWQLVVQNGYGLTYSKGKHGKAHRRIYELLVGPVPDDMHLDHLCRNTLCVNPAHMEIVTPAENVRRGNLAILVEDDVREIRRKKLAGEAVSELASKYGVTVQTIRDVCSRRSWKDIS